jgi:hypothetical protein
MEASWDMVAVFGERDGYSTTRPGSKEESSGYLRGIEWIFFGRLEGARDPFRIC